MRITIEVDDKLGDNIKRFCKLNNMTYTEYLSKIIEEKFNIDRFGDLNEKINKKKPVLKPIEYVEEETDVPNKDLVEPNQDVRTGTYIEEKKAPELNETIDTKKKKRQLKTK